MPSFKKLCEVIVSTNGNPTVKEVLDCGYTIDHFIRLCRNDTSRETLVQRAQESLNKMNGEVI